MTKSPQRRRHVDRFLRAFADRFGGLYSLWRTAHREPVQFLAPRSGHYRTFLVKPSMFTYNLVHTKPRRDVTAVPHLFISLLPFCSRCCCCCCCSCGCGCSCCVALQTSRAPNFAQGDTINFNGSRHQASKHWRMRTRS